MCCKVDVKTNFASSFIFNPIFVLIDFSAPYSNNDPAQSSPTGELILDATNIFFNCSPMVGTRVVDSN